MANDPRTFTVQSCAKDVQQRSDVAGKKKGFFDTLGKIGDMEFFNDIGLGKVSSGLRVLSSVSDAVRTGQSAVPGREQDETYNTALGKIVGTATDAVEEGATVVLETTGLDEAAKAVSNINPNVVNRAYGQAKNIYQRVKQGNFGFEDIPEVFQDLQNLEILGRGIFGGGSGQNNPRSRSLCGASPYARDLIAFAPKFQFLFIVEVILSSEYTNWNDITSQMAFVVKTSTRPEFTVEYEEVNMYNFRTKVPKRVEYPPITMSFYDDNKNAAHSFYTGYMRAMSPIANIKQAYPQAGDYEISGMDYAKTPSAASFDSTSPPTSGHSASLGALLGNVNSIVQVIKLYHIFDYGNAMNVYNFYNPRIQSFKPSDLSQLATGDGTEFEFEFAYDGLFIENGVNLIEKQDFLLDKTWRHGIYPIDPVYGELQPEEAASQATTPSAEKQEQEAPPTNFIGQFVDGIGGAVDGTTDAFGNVIGGLGNTITDALPASVGDFVDDVGGVVGDVTGGIGDFVEGAAGEVGNFTKGLTGAINDNISAAQKALGGTGEVLSNAFKAGNELASQAKAVNQVFQDGKALSAEGKKLFSNFL